MGDLMKIACRLRGHYRILMGMLMGLADFALSNSLVYFFLPLPNLEFLFSRAGGINQYLMGRAFNVRAGAGQATLHALCTYRRGVLPARPVLVNT